MSLSPVLARSLAAGRPRFNARVAAARRAKSGFDIDALQDAIAIRLDPLIVAIEAAAPDRVDAVTDAAFDLNVTLVVHGIAGDRRLLLDRLWHDLGTAYARLIAERPAETLALLTNAALTIQGTQGARAEEWIDRMAAVAPRVETDMLRAVGQLVAWRSGMAHFRTGALALADELPGEVAAAALGTDGDWADVRAGLAASPWWSPDGLSVANISIGGFTGFGGPFAQPPSARATREGFLIRAGQCHLLLVADAWGATLHPASAEEYDAADPSDVPVGRNGVQAGDRTVAVDLPIEGLSAVTDGVSLVIASPYSHFLRIMPWRLS